MTRPLRFAGVPQSACTSGDVARDRSALVGQLLQSGVAVEVPFRVKRTKIWG